MLKASPLCHLASYNLLMDDAQNLGHCRQAHSISEAEISGAGTMARFWQRTQMGVGTAYVLRPRLLSSLPVDRTSMGIAQTSIMCS